MLSMPLSYLQGLLPTRLKHVFGLVVGLVMHWVVLEMSALNPFGMYLLTWLLMHFGPRRNFHRMVCAMAVIWCSASHIYRMYIDYMGWTMDFTGAQMVAAIRCTLTAFNVADGAARAAAKARGAPSPLSKDEEEDALPRAPGIIPWLGYAFHFPSFHTGPCMPFAKYDAWAERPASATPSPLLPAALKFAQMLLCLIPYAWAMTHPFQGVLDAGFREAYPLWYRVVYLYATVSAFRFKYYTVWALVETSCILSGLSYAGKTTPVPFAKRGPWELLSTGVMPDGARWNGAKNIDVLGVELAQNMKGVTDHWNMFVGRFLHVYVYSRLAATFSKAGKRPPQWAVYATQLTSAAWHGFYGGYYMFFGTTATCVNVARIARQVLRPRAIAAGPVVKRAYDVVTMVATGIMMNNLGVAFVILDAGLAWAAWRAVDFFPLIALAVSYVALSALAVVLPPPREKPAGGDATKAAAAAAGGPAPPKKNCPLDGASSPDPSPVTRGGGVSPGKSPAKVRNI